MAFDLLEQVLVAFRTDMVQSASEYGDGASCQRGAHFVHGFDRAPMCRGVGAQRAAGYHQMSGTRHPKGQFVGALPTVVAYAP